MDVGVLCEGEETFQELLATYLEHGHLKDPELLQRIPGIVFRTGETLLTTAPRAPIEPLDRLPFPDRDLLGTQDTVIMLTSRGCPYKCLYCASTRFWRGIRLFSAEYIVREIRDLVERHHVRHIVFFDDLFIVSKERIRQLVPLIRAEKLHKRVSFNCLATANLVDDEIAQLLRNMNVRRVGMGLESGSERILKHLKGAHASVEKNMNAVRILVRRGIETEGSFILGAPDETEQDMLETLNFIRKSPLDRFDVHLLTPYPGTPFWDYALKRGLVSRDMSWERLYRDFAHNPDQALFLCEKTSRERAHEIFLELRAERDARDRKLTAKANLKVALTNPATIPRLIIRAVTRIAAKEHP
jgi:radical SAM superfamily enzyme YgiQ (UPF0313 family)